VKPFLSPASGPYGFDAATTAALVALLTSKADGQQFALGYTTSARQQVMFTAYSSWQWGTPGQLAPFGFQPTAAAIVKPTSAATARLYAWQAAYRGRRQGGQLAADAAYDALARGMLAQQAIEWMNSIDLRYGVSPSPNPTPDVAGLALDPRGNIKGTLLGYAGPKVDP
jgi:hypothetical protein